MFLGVSVSVRGVEMNETERAQLAVHLRAARTVRFKGNKKAAYTAAGVNAATWDRAEKGESIKEHTQIAIVSALWPTSGGDWTRIPDDERLASGEGLTPRDFERIAARLDELSADNAELRRRLDEAESRIEELYPSDPRTDEEREADTLRFVDLADKFSAEARALGLTDGEYLTHLRAEWGEPNVVSPLGGNVQVRGGANPSGGIHSRAARRGVSQGRRIRRAQDEAGEESQDSGGRS